MKMKSCWLLILDILDVCADRSIRILGVHSSSTHSGKFDLLQYLIVPGKEDKVWFLLMVMIRFFRYLFIQDVDGGTYWDLDYDLS